MRTDRFRVALLSALLGLGSLHLTAQVWDASTQATGWAHQDKDESFTFFDEGSATLHTWSRDGGLQRSTPLGKLPMAPEKWVVDPHNHPWVVYKQTLVEVGPNGKILKSFKLPAEVADVGWDIKGIVLSYRAPTPFLEKRDYKGSVVWTHGVKPPSPDEDTPPPVHRRPILVDDAGNILMASGTSLNLQILSGTTGQKVSEVRFSATEGEPPPALEGTADARGPMALWPGKEVVFATVRASQVPSRYREAMQGLALARLDLKQLRLEFLATGLNESHQLVGILDSDAVFTSPRGGLVLVKIR